MPARKTVSQAAGPITVLELDVGEASVLVRGTSPLIYNDMSVKSKRDLLLPRGRKTTAERAQTLKHDPRAEFRDSLCKWPDDDHPTRLRFPSPGFKKLLQTAALEVPGARKSQIGRLTWIEGTHVSVYGIPKLHMGVVRSADIAHTPDIRTRGILKDWCAEVTLSFTKPTLTPQVIATLLAAGGLICGVGDWRQEKGSGSYGQFRLVNQDDPVALRLRKEAGRKAQDEAIGAAEPYDADTEELLDWWDVEIARRGVKAA